MGSSPLKQPHKSPEAQAPPAVPPGRPYPGGGQGGTARWKGAPGAAGRQGVTARPWCQCSKVGNPLWERAGMAAGRAGAASRSPCLALPSSSTAGVVFHAETYEAQTFPLLSPPKPVPGCRRWGAMLPPASSSQVESKALEAARGLAPSAGATLPSPLARCA